jgi:bacillithiol system protein YtxJ
MYFKETTHLSDILETSEKTPVIIFKHSSMCGRSSRVETALEDSIMKNQIQAPIFKITVQTHPAISRKIEEWFDIKHESPQIIIVHRGKVTYTAHHDYIYIPEFVY